MSNHTKYRVRVDNYHAQFKKPDHRTSHDTAEAALDSLLSDQKIHDEIDEELMVAADKVADMEEDREAWDREYSRLWSEKKAEIIESGWEDGDGHRYYIDEEDDRAPFYVAVVRNYFGPSETISWFSDERGNPEEFATLEMAREAIKKYCAEPYVCDHNEASSPDLYIVDSSTKAWEENDDGGKFDWDECECEQRATDDELDDICDGYSVCDNERYGSVACIYDDDEIPTNAEFWAACGQSYDEDDKDDQIDTVSLADYVRENLDSWSKNIASNIPRDLEHKINYWVERREDGYCCGECDSCINYCTVATIAYIREHAIKEG